MRQAPGQTLGQTPGPGTLADQAFAQLQQLIFEFALMHGDRCSESELAQRLSVSRTPPARGPAAAGARGLFADVAQDRLANGASVGRLDEQFQMLRVQACGNREMARVLR